MSADVYITRKKAEIKVKNILMDRHEELVEQAIRGMDNSELARVINLDDDLYFHNVVDDNEEREND